ncbi:hypothetical protein [Actinomadura sp. 6N118]|uniref:hypothetical protein n=1 Tax=Actinomadura sp. 6N118 TaxID=3375151 RepID=UPI003788D95A
MGSKRSVVVVAALVVVGLNGCGNDESAGQNPAGGEQARSRKFRCGEKIAPPVHDDYQGFRFTIEKVRWPVGALPSADIALHASSPTRVWFPMGPTEARLLLLSADRIVGGQGFPDAPPAPTGGTPTVTAHMSRVVPVEPARPYRFTLAMNGLCTQATRNTVEKSASGFSFTVAASAWSIAVGPASQPTQDSNRRSDPLLIASAPAQAGFSE